MSHNKFTFSTNYFDNPEFVSDWISQSEAARLRGVTRQAISKLARAKRLGTLVIGGRTLVNRADVEAFVPRGAGRPRTKEHHVSDS